MQHTVLKQYEHHRDFLRIRDFLIHTYALYQRPFNWTIDRWEFVRYFVLPVHTYFNTRYFGVPTRTHHHFRDELPGWEKTIGIWEDSGGNIVGVVNSENEEPGEAWFQIHPNYSHLYDEMLTYAETHLADRAEGVGYVKAYIDEDSGLKEIAASRGYKKLDERITELEYILGDVLPEPKLPAGYVVRSVQDEDDIGKRRMAYTLAFGNNYSPSSWDPVEAFEALQQAPSYRKDLDLFLVAPNGEYASFCTIWIDEKNKYGNFEPVGTHPEYQHLGLGRALLQEGFRRMAQFGVKRSYMESGNPFYQRVGFTETSYARYPWIKYFIV